MSRFIKFILVAIVSTGIMILFMASIFFSELNQDEGWYLYAARLASQGLKPYADFSFTQGPLMCYFYGYFTSFINFTGIFGGRLITALLGIVSTLLASWLASRCVTKKRAFDAFIITLAICGLNIYFISFSTIVKTYALCSCLINAGFLMLTSKNGDSQRHIIYSILAGVFFGLATSVRISAGLALPIIFTALIIRDFKKPGFAKYVTALCFTAGAASIGAIIFLPLFIKSPEAFRFFLFEYHALRETTGIITALAYKAGFISRFISGSFIAASVLVIAIVGRWFVTSEKIYKNFIWNTATAVFTGITLLHLSASFPYDDYQIIVYPLMAAIAAIAIVNIFPVDKYVPYCTYCILILAILFSVSSPKLQEWLVTRDRIWWPIKTEYPLQTLHRAAEQINALKTNNILLTQDAYLAIETGMDLPENMEMGPFSYYPDMPTEKAAKLHVLNKEMLTEVLQTTDASVAAVSAYSFAIESPNVAPVPEKEYAEFMNIISNRYIKSLTINNFGQAFTDLDIFVK